MFLIYINDIANNISPGTHIRLFADDCVLYRVIQSLQDTGILQKDLTSLTDWSTTWQMSFNTAKCSVLRVVTKRQSLIHDYKMGKDILGSVQHHPYLGLELTHNLKWSEHIDNIISKANKTLWFVRRNLWRCPTSIKERMYFALIRPILENACAVWDPHTATDINKLEMVQRRAARFVHNNYKRSEGTVTKLLEQLKWPSLESRRKNARLITMFKIVHNKIAVTVPDHVQKPLATKTRQYHPAKFRVMLAQKNCYKFSFFPRTILDWNALGTDILDLTEIDSFISGLKNPGKKHVV